MALRPKSQPSVIGRSFELGIEIAGCVVIGTLLGYYADRWLGTAPAFLLVFMLFGFAAAIRVLFRFAQQAAPSDEASTHERDAPEEPDR